MSIQRKGDLTEAQIPEAAEMLRKSGKLRARNSPSKEKLNRNIIIYQTAENQGDLSAEPWENGPR